MEGIPDLPIDVASARKLLSFAPGLMALAGTLQSVGIEKHRLSVVMPKEEGISFEGATLFGLPIIEVDSVQRPGVLVSDV